MILLLPVRVGPPEIVVVITPLTTCTPFKTTSPSLIACFVVSSFAASVKENVSVGSQPRPVRVLFTVSAVLPSPPKVASFLTLRKVRDAFFPSVVPSSVFIDTVAFRTSSS